MGAKVADPATEGGGGLRDVSALLRLDKKGSRVMERGTHVLDCCCRLLNGGYLSPLIR